MERKIYLLNAFSLNMFRNLNAKIDLTEVSRERVFDPEKQPLISAIGHADTAAVLGVECNRINVVLGEDDVAYVAQLQGGRLPEGCTTLPEGFEFKFVRVDVTY